VISDDSSVRPATEQIDLTDFEFETAGVNRSVSLTSRISELRVCGPRVHG